MESDLNSGNQTNASQIPDAAKHGVDDESSQKDGQDSVENSASSTPATATINLKFLDFAADPIPGLKYQLKMGNKTVTGKTTVEGKVNGLDGLAVGTEVEVLVCRDHLHDFKPIGKITASAGVSDFACVSPKIRFDIETESHAGSPGKAHEDIPPVPKPIAIDGEPTAPGAAATTSTSAPEAIKVVAAGRNENGQPVAKVVDNSVDMVKQKNLAALHVWSWSDFAKGVDKNQPTKALIEAVQFQVNPTTYVVNKLTNYVQPFLKNNANLTVPDDKANAEALAALQKLIAFQEKQVLHVYTGMTSAEVKAKYAKEEAPSFPAKLATKSNKPGQCLKYVKVAAWKAGYASGITGTGYARDSGPDWVKFGFTDVTAAFPTVKVMPKGKKEEKDIVQMPDVVYALPGDIVVYKQMSDPKAPGHVDIRTYHGMASEFFWPGRGGFSDTSIYQIIGIYRKYSDLKASKRIQAFLRITREHEAKGFLDPYKALKFDPSLKPNPFVTFDGYHTHPSNAKSNKPAGAYQIKFQTWQGVLAAMRWEPDFTPAMQDRVAIYLLQSRFEKETDWPSRRTALGYILEGDIEKAVNQTKLWNEWAYLPGGGRQSQISMKDLKELFDKYSK